jgi:hypothetical protein
MYKMIKQVTLTAEMLVKGATTNKSLLQLEHSLFLG